MKRDTRNKAARPSRPGSSLSHFFRGVADREKKILSPIRLLMGWEDRRIHQFWKNLDLFSGALIGGILLLIIVTSLTAAYFLHREGVFLPPPLDPVLDFRVEEKYYTRLLSHTFGLFEDESKTWLGTEGDGIHQYEFDTKIWRKYDRRTTRRRLTGDYIREILPDATHIWLRAGWLTGDEGFCHGLNRYHIGYDSWRVIIGSQRFAMEDLTSISAIEAGRENLTWVGTDRFGLNRYDGGTRNWEFPRPLLDKEEITCLRRSDDALFAGSTAGLHKIDDRKGAPPRTFSLLRGRHVLQIEREEPDRIVYLSDGGEIGRVSGSSRNVEKLIDEDKNYYQINGRSLDDDEITAVCDAPENDFWIGTRAMGLAHYDKERHAWTGFNTYNEEAFPSNHVLSVASGSWGVAAGTRDGLFLMDPAWKTKRAFYRNEETVRTAPGEAGEKQVLWVETYRPAAASSKKKKGSAPPSAEGPDDPASVVQHKAKRRIERFEFDKTTPVKSAAPDVFIGDNLARGLKQEDMVCAVRDNHSQAWVGARGRGILVYKMDRRDWVLHEHLFEAGDLDLMNIRHLAIDNKRRHIYLVTEKGGLGRFAPRPVAASPTQKKIVVETIIHEGGRDVRHATDAAVLGRTLYIARKNNGVIAYRMDAHRWDDVTSQHHFRYFQKDRSRKNDQKLFGLTEKGEILQVPAMTPVEIPGGEPVDEFTIQNGRFLIKTGGGRLIVNNRVVIPNTSAGRPDFDSRHIVSAALDDATGSETKLWIAARKSLGLYNIQTHAWERSRDFNGIRGIHHDGRLVWVHTENEELFLLVPNTLEDWKPPLHQIAAVTYINGATFALDRVGKEKRLVLIPPDGTKKEIISGTSFYTVDQKNIQKALWDPRTEILYAGAKNKLGRYDHRNTRTWTTQGVRGDVIKMALNNILWVHTSPDNLYLFTPDLNNAVGHVGSVSDFTAPFSTGAMRAHALFKNGDLFEVAPNTKNTIIKGRAACSVFPGGADSAAVNDDETRIFIASKTGLSGYTWGGRAHEWNRNTRLRTPRVHFNGSLWSHGGKSLYHVDQISLEIQNKIRVSVEGDAPVLGFGGRMHAVYKEPGGQVFRTNGPPTSNVRLIGESFKKYNREEIHKVLIHPGGAFLYFGAQNKRESGGKENGAARVGRYNIRAHHWRQKQVKGRIEKFVLKKGILWCLTSAEELYGFDAKSEDFNQRAYESGATALAPHGDAVVIVQDGSVKTYDALSNTFSILTYNNRVDEKDLAVQQAALSANHIFIGTKKGLWKYDIPAHRWAKIQGAGGFYPRFGGPSNASKPRISTRIALLDDALIALDRDGRLFMVKPATGARTSIDDSVRKFQIVPPALYYLKSDGVYKTTDPGNYSLTRGSKKKLFDVNESLVKTISYVEETDGALYFGSREGVVQKYLPDAHRWDKGWRLKGAVTRIDGTGDGLVVETENGHLYVETKTKQTKDDGGKTKKKGKGGKDETTLVKVMDNVLDWSTEPWGVWILRKDGLYRYDKKARSHVQVLGQGKATFSRLRDVVQCVKGDENTYYFMGRNGALSRYNSNANRWWELSRAAVKKQKPAGIKRHGDRLAYLTKGGRVEFLSSAMAMAPTTLAPEAEIVDFELAEKHAYIVMTDGKVYRKPYKAEYGASLSFSAPVMNHLTVAGAEMKNVWAKFERKEEKDVVLINQRNIIVHDRMRRSWRTYPLKGEVSDYITLNNAYYFILDGKLHRLALSGIPGSDNPGPFERDAALLPVTAPGETGAATLKSIYRVKKGLIGLTEKGNMFGLGTGGEILAARCNEELNAHVQDNFRIEPPDDEGENESGTSPDADADEDADAGRDVDMEEVADAGTDAGGGTNAGVDDVGEQELAEAEPEAAPLVDYEINQFSINNRGVWMVELYIPDAGGFIALARGPAGSWETMEEPFQSIPRRIPPWIKPRLNLVEAGDGRYRKKADKVTAITLDREGALLYRLKKAPASRQTDFAFDGSEIRPLEADEFDLARRRWKDLEEEETRRIMDPGLGVVHFSKFSARMGGKKEWRHDRYRTMEKVDDALYIATDGGVLQYAATSGSRKLTPVGLTPREDFPAKSGRGDVLEWADGKGRLVRKDRFDLVTRTSVNGRKLTIRGGSDGVVMTHELRPGEPLPWRRGFEWDRVQDMGVDANNRIWLSHSDSVAVHDPNDKKLVHWYKQKGGVRDLLFHDNRGYFKAADGYHRIVDRPGDLSQWKTPDPGAVYDALRTKLAENGGWRFQRDKGKTRIRLQGEPIQFEDEGRFGIDRINDVISVGKDTPTLLWATDEGVYEPAAGALHTLGEPSPAVVDAWRRHPAAPGVILLWKDGAPHVYDHGRKAIRPLEEREREPLANILSMFDHDRWKFGRKGSWRRDGHEISFGNGRFGFDRVKRLLGEPIIFLTRDGIWEYGNGSMKDWLSQQDYHKEAERIFTSRYSPSVIYLETPGGLYQKKGAGYAGPMTPDDRDAVYEKENAIATNRAGKRWIFPAKSGQKNYTFTLIHDGAPHEATFADGRFGFDAVNDLEWVGGELHLAAADGLVRWNLETGAWRLIRDKADPGRESIRRSLKDRKRMFRSRIDGAVYIQEKRSHEPGQDFRWDGAAYLPADDAASKWKESETTLLEQGYGRDWAFTWTTGGDKRGIRLARKDHTGAYRPTRLTKGKFGFNRARMISAGPDALLMITGESRERFDGAGASTLFELTGEVEAHAQLLNDKHRPKRWCVRTKTDGFLWSEDGLQWHDLPGDKPIRDQFEGAVLTDRAYANWEFHAEDGFRRSVPGHERKVEFTIQQGQMSFDRLAPTGSEHTIAGDGDHIWYVTREGHGVRMEAGGKILNDYHPAETGYEFRVVYSKEWQFHEKALLAETRRKKTGETRRWENETWAAAPREPDHATYRDMLLKNDSWEIIRRKKSLDARVVVNSGKKATYAPMALTGRAGFRADHVNAVHPKGNTIHLATNEDIRLIHLNRRGWDAHAYYEGDSGPRPVQDVRLENNRLWARFGDKEYYQEKDGQWRLASPDGPRPPFARERFTADNWKWHYTWSPKKKRFVLDLVSVNNETIHRKFHPDGNFTDNLVHDFDASGRRILVSSRFGTTLYDVDGRTLALYPGFADARVLHQGNWFMKKEGIVRALADKPNYPEDAPAVTKEKPFNRQILTTGWGRWFKNEKEDFTLELHGSSLGAPILGSGGEFIFDQPRKLFIVKNRIWAAVPPGIIQYDPSSPLAIADYIPCRLKGNIRAVELEDSSLYFVGDARILDVEKKARGTISTFRKKRADAWAAIDKNRREQEILSRDRQWTWKEAGEGFEVHYTRRPEWKRTWSGGRFVDDQPLALYATDDSLCYQSPEGYYTLDKKTLLVERFTQTLPEEFPPPPREPERRIGATPLRTLFHRRDDLYALGDKYFYQIHWWPENP